MESPYNNLPLLPPKSDIETKKILKKAIQANTQLAKLNGYCLTIPNDTILVNSIILKEAQASSEIENIITTQDELYQALISKENNYDPQTKEVLNYRESLWKGYQILNEKKILSSNIIIEIQKFLENNEAGFRKVPGTALVNDRTGETIYTPPDDYETILNLMHNLENYINSQNATDPLIKMAIIHYQFESIHPFYDGNGRTGRIINVLYLVLQNLLNKPILYLSEYIIRNKTKYYEYLQAIRTHEKWEQYILFMLEAVEETAAETMKIIQEIRKLMDKTTEICRKELPSTTYSKELVESLFIQPYTKIEHLVDAGIAERRTASKYLKQLEEINVLSSKKIWKETLYINHELVSLLKKIR
jgi:Fic family protein